MKPTIPKGMRDFSPVDMTRRNFILNAICQVYRQHGYRQIETPAMENLSVLEGKYGAEGDTLLYRVLNSGKLPEGPAKIHDLSEKGLRYDLTVPFARYVVMHRNEITFPFKRYQVQPVWRADRPQKGRYREFYQCDADVIGSDSLLNEVEMVQMITEVFTALDIRTELRVNNRKVLAGLAEKLDIPDRFMELTIGLDKLEKAGLEKVMDEWRSRGIPSEALAKLEELLANSRPAGEPGGHLTEFLRGSEPGEKGIGEVQSVLDLSGREGNASLKFDLTLARGLNYYTGMIFEVKCTEKDSQFGGSLLGGGRYDDLTGVFGLPGVSGVGISFGVDRIHDVMTGLGKFDNRAPGTVTRVMFVNFGEAEAGQALGMADRMRLAGIATEVYPDAAKVKKQMSYADANAIPFVALLGSEEIKSGNVKVKDMRSGEQEDMTVQALIEKIRKDGET